MHCYNTVMGSKATLRENHTSTRRRKQGKKSARGQLVSVWSHPFSIQQWSSAALSRRMCWPRYQRNIKNHHHLREQHGRPSSRAKARRPASSATPTRARRRPRSCRWPASATPASPSEARTSAWPARDVLERLKFSGLEIFIS